MQQQFPTMVSLAPELVQAGDELGIAALLTSVAEILRSFGGAESLAYSVEEWAITIRSAALRTVRGYVQTNLMAQRVFDPTVCRCMVDPCVCHVGEQ